jgi:hypothetical protein
LEEYQRCCNQFLNDTLRGPIKTRNTVGADSRRYDPTLRMGPSTLLAALFGKLHLMQTGINAVEGEQFVMPAAFYHASILHDDDQVGVLDR